MYCPSCGAEVSQGSAFCSGCGAEVGAADPTPDPAPAGAAGGQSEAGATADAAGHAETASGLDENVAGTLSYLLGFVTGILFLLIEDDSDFVRFHAAQSTVVFGGLFVLGFALSFLQGLLGLSGIAYVGWMLAAILGLSSMLLSLAALVLWILLMVKAYNGERYALPLAGGFAERLAA